MKTTSILTAGIAAAALATSASAVTIALDDFTTPFSGDDTQATGSGGAELQGNAGIRSTAFHTVNPNGFTRDVTLRIDANNSAGGTNVATVGSNGGQLDMSAQADVEYTVFVAYAIGSAAASALPGADTTGSIDFNVLFADGNPRTVSLTVNGVAQDSFSSAQFTDGTTAFPELQKSLSFNTADLNGMNDIFLFSIDASAGLDYTVDFFDIDIPEAPVVGVPAPAALGLLGFGLAGLGMARRRKA